MNDHLGNIVNENKGTNMVKESTAGTGEEFNPATFSIPQNEINRAMNEGYALMLKTKKGLSQGEQRLVVVKMSANGSYKALDSDMVERIWYFDDQVQDSLIFALADACGHVPMFQANKWLTKFGITDVTVERVVLAALKEYENKFKVTHLTKGFEVEYKDALDRDVTATGHAFEILCDIRQDMIEKASFEEAIFEDLNDALPDTMSSTEEENKNAALIPFIQGMVG